MNYATIAARFLLGLTFVVFGINYFLKFLPTPELDGTAAAFMGALFTSGYLAVVKVIEIVGGALTLSGRYTPLGLLLLGPVVVNIVLFDIFLAQSFNPAGFLVAVLSTFLLIRCRKNFAGVLSAGKHATA